MATSGYLDETKTDELMRKAGYDIVTGGTLHSSKYWRAKGNPHGLTITVPKRPTLQRLKEIFKSNGIPDPEDGWPQS